MKRQSLSAKTVISLGLLVINCSLNPTLLAETKDSLGQFVNHQTTVQAQAYSAIFQGRGDGVRTCPVTGEKITKQSLKAEFFGRTVYFCCRGCLKAAHANPEKFIKASEKEQLSTVKAYLATAKQAASGEEYCNE